ncbi:MAG: hypothetical protein ACUVSM_07600 [Armatimonadota bacterium]
MRSCKGLIWMTLLALAVSLPVAAENLLLNPSFEVDPVEDGLAAGWAKYRSGDGIDGWLKPWSGPENDWVAVIGQWQPGQWAFWGQSAPCVPGRIVTFRAWTGGFPGFNGSTKVKLEFYYSNQEGGSMAISTAESSSITGPHGWRLQEVSVVVPPQAIRVRAMLWVDGAPSAPASGSAKFDDAWLETDGIPPRVTPGEVNGLPDNTLVWLKWPVVVKDNGSDATRTDCYVTGYGREGTCRVVSSNPIISNGVPVAVRPGVMLHVLGTVQTVNGEKRLNAIDIVPTNWDGPWPRQIGMTSKSMALPPNPSGQIVRLVGNVSGTAPDKSFVYVDDGANVPGEVGYTGVRVPYPGSPDDYPAIGDTVAATGVLWLEQGAGGKRHPVLYTRRATDFSIINIGSGGIGRNLLLNPGFEEGAANWDRSPQSVAPERWAARSGSWGMAFYAWDTYDQVFVGQRVRNIVPGASYSFSAYILKEVNHVGNVVMEVHWFDADGNEILPAVEVPVAAATTWQQFTVPVVAPAGASEGSFVIRNVDHQPAPPPGQLQAVMIDDVVVKMTATP